MGKTPEGELRFGADELEREVDEIAAANEFSGVVRVDHANTTILSKAYGFAHRGHGIPNTVETQFGIASGSKSLTALAVVHLIERGALELSTPARAVLGPDLPLVDARVTVEHLLAHRSGIGDYLDEDTLDDVNEYALNVPVHDLATTEQFLAVLDGHPSKFAPGSRFSYCNGGYVVLALIAERVSGVPFHELVTARLCEPADMHDTRFLRSDALPGTAALGYLHRDGLRTNVFHLPVVGNGDGGIASTAGDVRTFWLAFFAGRMVGHRWVEEMVRPRSDVPEHSARYGLGFWLHPMRDVVFLEGMDAGVSFRTVHDPARDLTHTVFSNTTDGAWPIARYLDGSLTEGDERRRTAQ